MEQDDVIEVYNEQTGGVADKAAQDSNESHSYWLQCGEKINGKKSKNNRAMITLRMKNRAQKMIQHARQGI